MCLLCSVWSRSLKGVSEVNQTVRDVNPGEIYFLNNKIILLQLWRHSYTASYHIYDFNSRLVLFARRHSFHIYFCNEMTFHWFHWAAFWFCFSSSVLDGSLLPNDTQYISWSPVGHKLVSKDKWNFYKQSFLYIWQRSSHWLYYWGFWTLSLLGKIVELVSNYWLPFL